MFISAEVSKLLVDSKFGYTVQNADAQHAAAFVAATQSLVAARLRGTGADNDDSARFGIDLEVALRQKLGELLASDGSAEVITKGRASSVFKLIHFSVQVAFIADQTGIRPALTVKKVPFLLLEDTFECQSCAILPELWSTLLLPLAPVLTSEVLFSAGKNMLLRMCNSLLRRLSRTCQTELVGSIKMFLASAFPINDPSAVNLQRRHNQNSSVQYTDDGEAYAASIGTAGKHMDVVKTTECADSSDNRPDDAPADSSATGPLFKYRLEAKDFVPEVKDESARTFEEYVKFWKLQGLLSAEPRGIVDPLPLMQSCKDALSLVESCEAGNIDVDSEERRLILTMKIAARTSATKSSESGEAANLFIPHADNERGVGGVKADIAAPSVNYLGVRYLTAPELLPLQLCSHQFRQQLAVQILLSCQSLRVHYRALALAYVPVSTDASATKAVEKSDPDASFKPDPRNPRAFEAWLASQLRNMEDRCFRIVTAGPHGTRLAALLRRVLFRELKWGYWKQDQCPSLTRESAIFSVSGELDAPNVSNSDSQPNPSRDTAYIFPKELSVVRELLHALYETVPSYDSYLEAFLDAEDPDNGIEDEYHPRHDKVYCWRAARLLAERCVGSFSKMHTGDLRDGLKYTSPTNNNDADSTRSIIILRDRPQPEIAEHNREPEVTPFAASASAFDATSDAASDAALSSASASDLLVQQEANVTVGDSEAVATKDVVATISEMSNVPAVDVEAEQPAVSKNADLASIHISCYNASTNERDIRNYVEKFASVTDVRMFPAQKLKNVTIPKYTIVGTTSAGASAFLNIKKHILKDANLKAHLLNDSEKCHTADLVDERNKAKDRDSEEGEEPDTLTQARKRRRA
jgi:hypothetical protein